MKALTPGCESEEKIDLLISLTNMKSKAMAKSLKKHLVDGLAEKYACTFNGTLQQNFNRDLKKVNLVAETIAKVNALDGLSR